METRITERLEMEELTLFEMTNSYDLSRLKQLCYLETKKKYPKAVDEEDYDEYLNFLREEGDLLFCERLREIADQIEKRILEPQKQDIQRIYKCR